MEDVHDVPLPVRPGTVWDFRHREGRSWCGNCGQDYDAHGAPEDEARLLGIARRSQACPASPAAWSEYWHQRCLRSMRSTIEHLVTDLLKFDPASQDEILASVAHRLQKITA